MPKSSETMEALRPIDFTTALVWLQEMIGCEVEVIVNHHGSFFGCGFQSRLLCVQTLPPDDTAVRVVMEDGQGLFLDPAELQAFAGGLVQASDAWLEFHMAFGSAVQIELAERDDQN